MNHQFEANGKTWATDLDTLNLIRLYRSEGNEEMVGAVFSIGQKFGRILLVS